MAEQEENLDGLKVTDLKDRCKDAGLKVSGSKAELVARLKEFLSSSSKTLEDAQAVSVPVPNEAPDAAAEAGAADKASDEPTAPDAAAAKTDDAAATAEAKKSSGKGSESANEGADTGETTAEPAIEEPAAEESIPARVARIWTEHAKTDEKLANADRLTISSAYRQWAKTADLGLEGTDVPPFTEVWMALEKVKKAAASADDKGDRKRGRGDAVEQRGEKRRGDAVEVCNDFRRNRCRRGANCRYVHDLGDRQDDRSRPSRNLEKADAAKHDSDDPLAGFAAEAHTIYKDGEEPKAEGDKEKANANNSKLFLVSRDDGKLSLAYQKGHGDKENAKESGEHGGANELERELNRRAAQRAGKEGGATNRRAAQRAEKEGVDTSPLDEPLANF